MKNFKQFLEDKTNEMTGTSAVAGAGDDSETVPVDMKKKKKELDVLKRMSSVTRESTRERWSK
jgi:hypothetical protein|tara:strand:- start:542 stop:730 length:189 start_codon:yes stop_codon:yes gene_type:complete